MYLMIKIKCKVEGCPIICSTCFYHSQYKVAFGEENEASGLTCILSEDR